MDENHNFIEYLKNNNLLYCYDDISISINKINLMDIEKNKYYYYLKLLYEIYFFNRLKHIKIYYKKYNIKNINYLFAFKPVKYGYFHPIKHIIYYYYNKINKLRYYSKYFLNMPNIKYWNYYAILPLSRNKYIRNLKILLISLKFNFINYMINKSSYLYLILLKNDTNLI